MVTGKILSAALCVLLSGAGLYAQESKTADESEVDLTPKFHGTVRGKYEYQPEDGAGRFEVRNARFSVSGNVTHAVEYKLEVDLCDEGKIKMLDAYTRLSPNDWFKFTIGQMRVPFTIDAHRSPHQRFFANRSFIAKQVGNVRDVGMAMGFDFKLGVPMKLEGGIFNGSGLTNQKDFWTSEVNYSGKLSMFFPKGFNLVLSMQKVDPDIYDVMMYDVGAFYHNHGLHVEAEFLYKTYQDGLFDDVCAFNSFVFYDIPLKEDGLLKKITPLVRFDMMDDHSDGMRYDASGEESTAGTLIINDYARSRITGGLTFSLSKPFISDIRLNYEHYFYKDGGIPQISEKNKIVIEFMTRF